MAKKTNPLKANRLFILFLAIALVVGALLPLAGIPALAGLLATMVAPVLLTSVMLPALAAINAGLFMAGVCLIRAVDFGLAAWKIRKKSAGVGLIKNKEIPETSIIYTKISQLHANKPIEWLLDKIEANPWHTIGFMMIFAVGCAMTFIPLSFLGGGPAILLLGLAQISLPLVPVTAGLLNGAVLLTGVMLCVGVVHLAIQIVKFGVNLYESIQAPKKRWKAAAQKEKEKEQEQQSLQPHESSTPVTGADIQPGKSTLQKRAGNNDIASTDTTTASTTQNPNGKSIK